MSEKSKKVVLKNKRGVERDFDFAHALALLRLQSKTGSNGWEISDKQWQFKDNEICKRPGNTSNKETSK